MTKEQFLKDVGNWSNHRHLLWPALEATKGDTNPVLEMGCGDGSTPYLQQYCKGRTLRSIDSNKEWADKFGAEYTKAWDFHEWFYKQKYSVVLVDQAPGEHRKQALELFAQFPIHAQIIVVHDSEPPGWNASDYRVRPLFKFWQYHIDFESPKPGAWASALSNNIAVTKWTLK